MLRPILFFPSTSSLLLIAGITSNSGVSSKQGMCADHHGAVEAAGVGLACLEPRIVPPALPHTDQLVFKTPISWRKGPAGQAQADSAWSPWASPFQVGGRSTPYQD